MATHVPIRITLLLVLALGLVMLGSTTVVWGTPETGQTYYVNSLADTDDGVCNMTNCTLREAIIAANANSSSADTINFSITGTINLSSQLPDLTNTAGVTINGTGITLNGGNSIAYGLRSVSTQNNTISGLTLQNFTTAAIEFVTYTSST
ncbi:MAG: CSLREA domain-containing protein, partial [Caldilineales bacterium]|nr:CSLREA domain-containing protein [Caldilineales bacterium]